MIKKRYYIAVFIIVLILSLGYLNSSIGKDSGVDGLHIPVGFEPIKNSVVINNSGLYTDGKGTTFYISKATNSEIDDWLYNDPDSTVTKLDNGMFRILGILGYCEYETIDYWELIEYKNTYYIVDVSKHIDLNINIYSFVEEDKKCHEELQRDLDKFNSINNVEPLDINI